ncbi:MAG: class I SAM-dependent methyltransferase [Ardenticatenia bacterium]|nr:class I SAM-dependent methyltransferase [Ardenticatenia bacterium]
MNSDPVAFFVERGRWAAAGAPPSPTLPVKRVADFVEQVAMPTGARRVLHLGCGLGHLSIELARRGHRPVAVDVSPDLVAEARAQAMVKGVPVAFLAEELLALDFPPYFDLVLAVETELPFYGTATTFDVPLAHVAALLRPGGRLLFGRVGGPPRLHHRRVYETPAGRAVETVTFDEPTRTLTRTLRVEADGRTAHWRTYVPRPREIEESLAEAGFVVLGKWHQYDPHAVQVDARQPGLIWLAERI